MTDDQITALAREYAEEVYRNVHKEMEVLPSCLSNEAINMFAEDMESKLKWLLRRYCLVEKSKVKEVYKNTKSYKSELESFSRQSDCCSVKLRLLESLFPEIAKEVEE